MSEFENMVFININMYNSINMSIACICIFNDVPLTNPGLTRAKQSTGRTIPNSGIHSRPLFDE